MLRSKLIVFALLLFIQVCQVQSLGTLRSKANPNKLRNRSIWNKKSLKEI
jgi:lysosomal Pro-X carboxypeptidase